MTLPKYENINLSNLELKWGYYVPCLIEKYRPDIKIIGIRQCKIENSDEQGNVKDRHREIDYSSLPAQIDKALLQQKKVALLINDELIFSEKNDQLTEILNYYKDKSVYLMSEFDQERINMHYRTVHGLSCKILEFPWICFNECLVYDKIKQFYNTLNSYQTVNNINDKHTFFTLVGRYESFRKTLLTTLIDRGLDRHGLLTIQNNTVELYKDLEEFLTVEPYYPYNRVPIQHHEKMGAQFLENDIWLSCNTQNFLYIEQTYENYPLAIIPETCQYDYFPTEKSFWPALLGKLFLVVGSRGCMQNIQRFYDIDMSEFLNLEFDSINGIDTKIAVMIDQNRDFILNSQKVYTAYFDKIQAAKNTITPNLYKFLKGQLKKVL